MATVRLTEKFVAEARCPAGRKDVLIFDNAVPGFCVRITAAGGKTYLAQYNAATGKRRVVLGRFGDVTQDEARREAKAVMGDVAKRRDPFAERKAAEATARSEKAAAKLKQEADAFTVARLIDAWHDARAQDRRPQYINPAAAALRKHLAAWASLPAARITTRDAVLALDRIKRDAGPIAANRALAYASAAFQWAAKRQSLPSNPFRGIERPTREVSRDRVLDIDELGAIWRAAATMPMPYGPFIRVLMLTLQRRNEVAGMRWDELDSLAEPTVWTVPAARAKNHRATDVHLSEPVRQIIADVPRIQACPFLFTPSGQRQITGFSDAKRLLDRAIDADRPGLPPLQPWILHDFRRSGVSALAAQGVPPHIADRILNHIAGSISGVAAVYQRHEFAAERAAALDLWATLVLRAAG